MADFTVKELLQATKGCLVSGRHTGFVRNISTDTRSLQAGDCFVALVGENFDGHDFVEEALTKKACALIVEKKPAIEYSIPVIIVSCTRKAIFNLAIYYRKSVEPIFIGITGSMGKTTVKEMVYQILAQEGNTVKSEKSFNNELGTPFTLFKVKKKHKWAVLEMGTNAPGEIARLSKLVRPDVGVITCVAETHLEKLGTIAGVEKAKGELLEGMSDESVLIVNGDDPACMRIGEKFSGKVITFARDNEADYRADNIEVDDTGIRFSLDGRNLYAAVPGAHNIYNILACIAIVRQWQISWDKLVDYLKRIELPPMRMEIKTVAGITIIEDCYNSSPRAVIAAVQGLDHFKGQRKIAILGSMLELGDSSAKLHYQTGKTIYPYLDQLWTVGDDAIHFVRGAGDGGMSAPFLFHCTNIEKIIEKALQDLKKGDIVLIKTSRKFQLEKIHTELKRILTDAN